jgi:hypothetical protein
LVRFEITEALCERTARCVIDVLGWQWFDCEFDLWRRWPESIACFSFVSPVIGFEPELLG